MSRKPAFGVRPRGGVVLTLLGVQSRFGLESLYWFVVCPQNGAAVLKGSSVARVRCSVRIVVGKVSCTNEYRPYHTADSSMYKVIRSRPCSPVLPTVLCFVSLGVGCILLTSGVKTESQQPRSCATMSRRRPRPRLTSVRAPEKRGGRIMYDETRLYRTLFRCVFRCVTRLTPRRRS